MSSSTTSTATAAVSGLMFGAFMVTHLLGHFSTHFGLAANRKVLAVTQPVYQHPLVEMVLLGSFITHAALAVQKKTAEWRKKGRIALPWDEPAKLAHQLSGWALMMLVPGHAFATRGLTWYFGFAPVDAAYTNVGARTFPRAVMTYYITFSLAAVTHIVSGCARAARALAPKLKAWHPAMSGPRFWLAVVPLGLLASSSVLAVSGIYFDLGVEPEVRAAIVKSYKKYWPEAMAAYLAP